MTQNPLLDAALQYAARGWPVFRLNGYKKPFKGSHGFKDATTDRVVIEAWWAEKPWANIGLATGELVVFDPDGAAGAAEFAAMAAELGGIPRTLVHSTGRAGNRHFVYRAPVVADAMTGTPQRAHIRSHNGPRAIKKGPGLDIKAHGGYVVLPPSVSRETGATYAVELDHPIADLTPAMADWIARRRQGAMEGKRPTPAAPSAPAFGGLPAHLQGLAPANLAGRALDMDREAEREEFTRNLMLLPVGNYDHWFETGAAIHDFDPLNSGLALFVKWSNKEGEYGTEEDEVECEKKWLEYGKPKEGKRLITRASVYGEAKQYISEIRLAEAIQPLVSQQLTTFAFRSLPPQEQFEDLDEDGNPRGTCLNASIAIGNLGVVCRKDVFHEKMLVGGHAIQQWAGDLSDDAVHMLRRLIRKGFGFEAGEKNVRDAAVQLCLENQFNPVTDYLDALVWDRQPRLSTWLSRYLGAADTLLTQAIGRLVLVAAVRRAYEPGTKFDQILVLEGPEGRGKSSAIEILAGTANYSDQRILTLDDKGQQEAICGVWLYEIADLAGMRRAEVEAVKAFASRTWDRARPAYGRMRVDRARQCVFVATTNDDAYLKSQTGNRRFWPVLAGHVDLARLRRDRDQLWAEAAEYEAAGKSLVLDGKLWAQAAEQQEDRRESDTWEEKIADYVNGHKNDVSVVEVLEGAIMLHTREIGQTEQTRAARVLKHLGMIKYRARKGELRTWRYKRN